MPIRLLRRWPLVIVMVGAIWFFQGIGVLPGSFMSGEPMWAYIGGTLVLTGALLAVSGPRRR